MIPVKSNIGFLRKVLTELSNTLKITIYIRIEDQPNTEFLVDSFILLFSK